MLKVNNEDIRTTPSLLLTLNIFQTCSSVSIVNFGHVIAGWVDGSSVFRKITHDKEIVIK